MPWQSASPCLARHATHKLNLSHGSLNAPSTVPVNAVFSVIYA